MPLDPIEASGRGTIRRQDVAMVDAPTARAILRVLADSLPENVRLEKVSIDDTDAQRVVVRLQTTHPRWKRAWTGGIASELRYQLSAAVPGRGVELQIAWSSSPVGLGDREDDATAGAGAREIDVVPNLVGVAVGTALAKAISAGFPLTTGDPDGTPVSFYATHGEWVITWQTPQPGGLAPCGSPIVVDVEERGGGGESGDREPRIPRPPGGVVRMERPLASGDSNPW